MNAIVIFVSVLKIENVFMKEERSLQLESIQRPNYSEKGKNAWLFLTMKGLFCINDGLTGEGRMAATFSWFSLLDVAVDLLIFGLSKESVTFVTSSFGESSIEVSLIAACLGGMTHELGTLG